MILYVVQVLLFILILCLPVQWNIHHLTRLKNCSRSQSSIVRQLLHKAWKPIFKQFNVKMPESCPLHISRDVFHKQELRKIYYRSNLWVCDICGKSFHQHVSLDLHMARKHATVFSSDDAAVCLADYCDIFRCHSYLPPHHEQLSNDELARLNTSAFQAFYPDLGLQSTDSNNPTALAEAPPRELLHLLSIQEQEETVREMLQHVSNTEMGDEQTSRRRRRCCEKTTPESGRKSFFWRRDTKRREVVSGTTDEVQQWISSSKEDTECDPGHMERLAKSCEETIDECMDSLLPEMDDSKFKEMRGSLHHSTCWYLHCDRRFEKIELKRPGKRTTTDLHFSVFIMAFVALALALAFACYIVWFCF